MSTTISRVQQTGLKTKSIWVLVTINGTTRLYEAANVPSLPIRSRMWRA